MLAAVNVAIIGAGPYGLSIVAHLGAQSIDHRIFGGPLQMWQQNMPPGMLLKSDGKSSDLSDPGRAFTLEEFCRARQIEYHRAVPPVKIGTFIAHGLAFQEQFVPQAKTIDATGTSRRAAKVCISTMGNS